MAAPEAPDDQYLSAINKPKTELQAAAIAKVFQKRDIYRQSQDKKRSKLKTNNARRYNTATLLELAIRKAYTASANLAKLAQSLIFCSYL